ncbi:MAG: hypothetical protein FJY95_18585 [Candidatus Handelsmanbacteria bacterium]|nr:hypothetical protein [Candidatus Handelsmanbacteria bacterium]
MSHLQSQSHIPLNTWRKWRDLLKMNPREVVHEWDQICYLIMIATAKLPEITYILQLWTHRLAVDIKTFKTETSRVLRFITFLYNRKDERLTQGKIKTNLHKFYRMVSAQPDGDPAFKFGHRIVRQLFSVTLSGVLNLLGESRGTWSAQGRKPQGRAGRILRRGGARLPRGRRLPPADEPEPEPEAEAGAAAAQLTSDNVDLDEMSDDEDFSRAEEAEAAETSAGGEGRRGGAGVRGPGDPGHGEVPAEGQSLPAHHRQGRVPGQGPAQAEGQEAAPEAVEGDEERAAAEDQRAKLPDMRLRVIGNFDPVGASIPTVEEEQQTARRAEIARTPKRLFKSSLSASGGGGGASGAKTGLVAAIGGAGGGGAGAVGAPADGSPAGARPPNGKGKDAVAMAAAAMAAAHAEAQHPQPDDDVNPADVVEVKKPNKNQFSDAVRQSANILATFENANQVVWSPFLDPGVAIKDLQTQARTLVSLGTGATQAFQSIEKVAQQLPLKQLVAVCEQVVRKGNFLTKVTPFINTGTRTNKPLEPGERLVSLLPEILDNTAGALLRMEVLHFRHTFACEEKEGYTRKSVIDYAEKALVALTNVPDREVLTKARARCDSDADTLIEIYDAERFTEHLAETCWDYAAELISGTQIRTVDQATGPGRVHPDHRGRRKGGSAAPGVPRGVQEGERLRQDLRRHLPVHPQGGVGLDAAHPPSRQGAQPGAGTAARGADEPPHLQARDQAPCRERRDPPAGGGTGQGDQQHCLRQLFFQGARGRQHHPRRGLWGRHLRRSVRAARVQGHVDVQRDAG